ncbi:transcription termination factor Rho [Oryzobacter telluris]|uniref:transcription termination factor Rho n=1 Tax=Oryzobacter telluris TaxID=3149179 RepID=UPI00370D73A9
MRLAELQGLASSMGISGTAKMRKGDLVAAIKARQNGESGPASAGEQRHREPVATARAERAESTTREQQPAREQRADDSRGDRQDRDRGERQERTERPEGRETTRETRQDRGERQERSDRQDRGDRQNQPQGGQQTQNRAGTSAPAGNGGANAAAAAAADDEDRSGRRRRNRGRNRDKRRPQDGVAAPQQQDSLEQQIFEDDVLVPVAGILDILDNYAFVRTTGYLPGSSDIYVPLQIVKRHGLRKGDAVTGSIKATREGEEPQQQAVGGRNSRAKYTPLARLDTINGQSPDEARTRPEFGKLTPLYPQDRLRLETEQNLLTTRIIDLVAPIGKGQRGLIVAPAKAGKTMVMQALANAITTNNPECHLMVVLVDERPEEVTDMQRAVKGEVISSTFDRPAEDHTTVAELAIERAKRLVEMGHDVVVLLDSITKLGRAYNLSAPASGRILSGGVDSAALYPPKKFFGAARNIENGGSLTILATALVETGSRMDEVIFEEFKGTGNMELKLDRQLANRRIFPAVDVNNSGTRKEEILLAPEELRIMWKLRRVLAALDSQQGIELLLDRLRKTKTNYEFLTQVQQTATIKLDDEDA